MSDFILTNENYFSPEANRAYYSVSQIKRFMECEACAMAELNGEYAREKSQSLLVGGYIDAHFSHELDLFRAQNPEIYTRTGTLRSEYQQAEEIIARIERDPLAMRMMDGDRQRIFTGSFYNCARKEEYPFKVKLDVLLDADTAKAIAKDYPDIDDMLFSGGAIVDMKIMRDFAPLYKDGEGRLNFIEYWRYDLQMAVYQAIVFLKTGARLPCYILAATKEKVPDIGLFQVPQEIMDAALEVAMEAMPRIADVKSGKEAPERCESCDYCKQTKVLTGATWLEAWA